MKSQAVLEEPMKIRKVRCPESGENFSLRKLTS